MTTKARTKVWTPNAILITAGLLVAQFAAAYYIGTSHLLANDNQLPVPPIAITVVVPVTGFLAAYFLSARFREFVLA